MNLPSPRLRAAAIGAVAALSALTFLGHAPRIVWDMAWYMTHAANLALGLGYVGAEQQFDPVALARGPLFPALLALALRVDYAVPAAFWVVRGFALAAPLAVLFAAAQAEAAQPRQGVRLPPVLVGATAAAVYLSSFAVNASSMRHLDAVFPVLGLLASGAAAAALARADARWAVAAGALLAAAYLTKEAALMYFAWPLGAWLLVPAWRTRANLKRALLAVAVAVGIVLLWLAYVYARTHQFYLLGRIGGMALDVLIGAGENGPEAAAVPDGGLAAQLATLPWLLYGRNGLVTNLPLGWAWLAACLYVLVRARRCATARLVALGLLLTLPMVVINARFGWRFGYNLPWYGFAAIAVAYAMADLSRWAARGSPRVLAGVAALLVIAAYGLNTVLANGHGRSNAAYLRDGAVLRVLTGVRATPANYFHFAAEAPTAILARLAELGAAGGTLMVDQPPRAEALYFYGKGHYRVHALPALYCFGEQRLGYSTERPVPPGAVPVDYRILRRGDTGRLYGLRLLFAEPVLALARRDHIAYLVTTGYFGGLDSYLAGHPAFERVGRAGSGRRAWVLWHIDLPRLGPGEAPAPDGRAPYRAIEAFRREHPDQFERLLDWQRSCVGPDFGRDWVESLAAKPAGRD